MQGQTNDSARAISFKRGKGLNLVLVVIPMPQYTVKIEVIDILGEGNCSMDQKIGDVYSYPEDRGKMCPTSFCIMWPMILVMLSGGRFDGFEDDGTSTTAGCSDYRHQIVYKITRNTIPDL